MWRNGISGGEPTWPIRGAWGTRSSLQVKLTTCRHRGKICSFLNICTRTLIQHFFVNITKSYESFWCLSFQQVMIQNQIGRYYHKCGLTFNCREYGEDSGVWLHIVRSALKTTIMSFSPFFGLKARLGKQHDITRAALLFGTDDGGERGGGHIDRAPCRYGGIS